MVHQCWGDFALRFTATLNKHLALQCAGEMHAHMQLDRQDLAAITTESMDRVIANIWLQLTPDPDAMLRETKRVLTRDGSAWFTIWGRPAHTGVFTIDAAVSNELSDGDGEERAHFALGKDLAALRRCAAAGFSRVHIWPYLCVLSLWSGNECVAFIDTVGSAVGVELRALLCRTQALGRRFGS